MQQLQSQWKSLLLGAVAGATVTAVAAKALLSSECKQEAVDEASPTGEWGRGCEATMRGCYWERSRLTGWLWWCRGFGGAKLPAFEEAQVWL